MIKVLPYLKISDTNIDRYLSYMVMPSQASSFSQQLLISLILLHFLLSSHWCWLWLYYPWWTTEIFPPFLQTNWNYVVENICKYTILFCIKIFNWTGLNMKEYILPTNVSLKFSSLHSASNCICQWATLIFIFLLFKA